LVVGTQDSPLVAKTYGFKNSIAIEEYAHDFYELVKNN
jgi:hypothetical protein